MYAEMSRADMIGKYVNDSEEPTVAIVE